MPTSLEKSSPSQKILYSFQKALDETLSLGAVPYRIFNVLYPIRVINVHGTQRSYTDMEEIQAFIERGIAESGLNTLGKLEDFFGLDADFVNKMIAFLKNIGHVTVDRNGLALTLLGIDSVREGVSYREYETDFKLYFDAIGNLPLSQAHFRVKVFDPDDSFQSQGFLPISPVFSKWDPLALKELERRKDRSRFGIMDEVKSISEHRQDPFVYMPVYVVERFVSTPDMSALPVYLVFGTMKGYRDIEIETAINRNFQALEWVKDKSSADDAITKRLISQEISPGRWTRRENSEFGIEIVVRAEDLELGQVGETGSRPRKKLTIDKIGRYMLAADWCFWLTCDIDAIRFGAGVQNCLEWLQNVSFSPSKDAIQQFISTVNKRLSLSTAITAQFLLEDARKRKMSTAIERLETML